jgi:hypothetical protein
VRAAIHGELTADGTRIVLVAGGPVEDIAFAAKQLGALTPLIKQSQPKGALILPATWPAVVQLSATYGDAWRPGPRLHQWILDQAAARTAAAGGSLTVPIPAGLTPRPYQVAGARMIAELGRVLITDEPGCLAGDTEITVNRAGKGFRMKLRDLVARFTGDDAHLTGRRWDRTIPTYVQRERDGVVRLVLLVNAWASGRKTTYTVTTDSGRTVRATDEHPFLTERGWQRLDQLEPGDEVHVIGGQAAWNPPEPKPRYVEVAGLPAHPFARGVGRRTSRYRVAKHRLVAEAARNGLDYEVFVDKIRAGDVGQLEFLNPLTWAVHHRDHNHLNNAIDNLEVLTHEEHHRRHAAEGKARSVLHKITTERVVSVERFGEEETFDLEVLDDPHNFLANGFVVHNTGKTITTILGLGERIGHLEHGGLPIVVVAPASVVDPWVEALRRWAPYWTTVAWRGSPVKRKALAGTADVYVVSYDTARMDAKDTNPARSPLVALDPRALVADECHLIKNHNAARTAAVHRLTRNVTTFVALSGTPITHHPGDLWPALRDLAPGAWPSRERWVNRYCLQGSADYGESILGLHPGTEPEFRLAVLGQHRRVAKADVLDQLPPKVYSVRTVTLPPEYRKAYDQLEAEMLAELPDGQELSVMDALSQLTILSRLACAAADVEITIETDDDDGIEKRHIHLELKAPSWKVDALLEVLDERDGSPVVAFAPSRQLMVLAGQAAAAAGKRVGYVLGGQTMTERTATVDRFQRGELDLICATTGAGGVGLTLTAASTVVFLQRPWSLVESVQAEDRCHRIGSEIHDSIEIVDIVAADTIDTRVRAVLREKAGQLADLVQDPRIVAELLGGATVTRLKPTQRKAS